MAHRCMVLTTATTKHPATILPSYCTGVAAGCNRSGKTFACDTTVWRFIYGGLFLLMEWSSLFRGDHMVRNASRLKEDIAQRKQERSEYDPYQPWINPLTD